MFVTNHSHLSNSKSESDAALALVECETLLSGMTRFWFDDMIDPSTNRFYYLCRPPTGERVHVHMPMRDLAAAWDATKILGYLEKTKVDGDGCYNGDGDGDGNDDSMRRRRSLLDAVATTLSAYSNGEVDDGSPCLDASLLGEAPNIGHSAMMILAAAGELRLCCSYAQDSNGDSNSDDCDVDGKSASLPVIDRLVRGILSRQRSDGAFRTEFDSDDVYRGIDFFPGEAMVSLMAVYELTSSGRRDDEGLGMGVLRTETRDAILPAMELAFGFYSDYYHARGDEVGTNFNVWQTQAFARFAEALEGGVNSSGSGNVELLHQVRNHCTDLCRGIIDSKAWKYDLSRGRMFYPNLETVEIACGLDALVDGMRLSKSLSFGAGVAETEWMDRPIANAVDFLAWTQDRVPRDAKAGFGGLGYGGTYVQEQRLDVTGHAVSALTKLWDLRAGDTGGCRVGRRK